MIELSKRMKRLPPYLFAELENTVNKLKAEGVDLISFGVGDPDLPPPKAYLEKLSEEAANPKNHNYSFSRGEGDFRIAVSEWYKLRFGVDLNPETEVVALIGSKEGLANIARAFIDDGDRVLVPDPAYPVYRNGATLLSDGQPIDIPLLKERGFKPDLNEIGGKKAKMLYLNYPNNPTGAVVDLGFLEELVEKAREENLIVCYDNAYSEIAFDGYTAPSIMQVDGAKEVAVEFHSCSKTLSVTGDRIGFAVGCERLIKGLVEVKSQIDSGPPVYLQKAAAWALRNYGSQEILGELRKNVSEYQRRRDRLAEGLSKIGLKCFKPKATFYLWVECGSPSMEFAGRLLEAGVVATPGVGFGKHGEGYLRFALTIPLNRIEEALSRIQEMIHRGWAER